MGDVNIDFTRYFAYRKTSDFFDTLYANGFIPLINKPTGVTSQSATVIDHLYTNNLNVPNAKFQWNFVTNITDNYPFFHMCRLFNSTCFNKTDEYFYTWRMNLSDWKTFKMLITRNDWNNVMNKSICGDAFGTFYAHIKSCYHQAFPLELTVLGWQSVSELQPE